MERNPPTSEPLTKLVPIIKLIGRLTVSVSIKLTFLLFMLFCMPIINITNKHELKTEINNKFLKGICIYKGSFIFDFSKDYKFDFLLSYFFLPNT